MRISIEGAAVQGEAVQGEAVLGTAVHDCKNVMDIGFILDSSGSLRLEYHKEKEFLNALAEKFGVSENGNRVGVITFSYYPVNSIKLKTFTDISKFQKAVENIALMGSTTNIDRALRLTQKEMFSTANGGRPNVPKILILLTDGTQSYYMGKENPAKITAELRQEGVKVLVIGIGKGTKKSELVGIAGKSEDTFDVNSFDDLVKKDFVNKIYGKSCKEG